MIKVILTEQSLYTKWVGAELVNALDMHDIRAISCILHNRKTLTSTLMLGKEGDPNISIYIEALGEDGRCPIAIFIMSKEIYGATDSNESEQESMHRLSHLIEENYYSISLEDEDDFDDIDDVSTSNQVIADKLSN